MPTLDQVMREMCCGHRCSPEAIHPDAKAICVRTMFSEAAQRVIKLYEIEAGQDAVSEMLAERRVS